jgi:hypothetical protein
MARRGSSYELEHDRDIGPDPVMRPLAMPIEIIDGSHSQYDTRGSRPRGRETGPRFLTIDGVTTGTFDDIGLRR